METPLLDRIRYINRRKSVSGKRKCIVVADKSSVDTILDQMDNERRGRQVSAERFISKKMTSAD